jgi:ArsR family transcriptional regulator
MTQMSKKRPATPKQASRRKSAIDSAMDTELFKALSDPTRTKLLACLAKCGRGCTVGELAECSDVDFSVVSRHLTLLARAGVVAARKNGRAVYYHVQFAAMSQSFRALANAIDACSVGACCEPANCGCHEK